MPYLQEDWSVVEPDGRTERVPRGLWIPERDWVGWRLRGLDVPLAYRWREEQVRAAEEPYRLPRTLTLPEEQTHLRALGGDLGSVQRDGFFYANFVEQLKRSPTDETATDVIRTMESLDFASVRWPQSVGGPPPHCSPWPWRPVLNWLWTNLRKVGAIILKIADTLVGILIGGGLGVSAVTVSAGLTPQIGVEFSTELFNSRFWVPVREFLERSQEEIAGAL